MSRYVHVDPSTGQRVRVYPQHDDAAIEGAVASAWAAWQDWRRWPVQRRCEVLLRAGALLRERADRYGRLVTEEMGKPIAQARAEIEKCAWVCEHYAEHAPAMLADEPVATDATRSWVQYDPLGLVVAVMPWNFPFWQLFRFCAPGLAAGDGFLLKHAPNVPGCAEAAVEVLEEAGLPPGLAANLRVEDEQVAALLADRRVAAATLTGSPRAGAAVGSTAARHLKPSVLELGGSDPFVVLADADVERAAEVGAAARLINSGQSCIAAKRFVVVREVADAFLEAFRGRLAAAVVGPPLDPGTTVGPLARDDLRQALHAQVERSVAAGACLELGGRIPDGPGFFYPVTLLTGVRPGMPAWDEEVFGPVAAVRVVDDEHAAVAAANDSRYGLGASLWTRDTGRARELARRIDAGCVFFNELVKSDPRVPFGGIKDSGYGRELGAHGLREFVNRKTVWVA